MAILDILEENPFVFGYLLVKCQEYYKKDLEERLINNMAYDQLIYLNAKRYDDINELMSVIVEYPILFQYIEDDIKSDSFCKKVIKKLIDYNEVLGDLHNYILDFIPEDLFEDLSFSRYLFNVIGTIFLKLIKTNNNYNEIGSSINELYSSNSLFRKRLFLFLIAIFKNNKTLMACIDNKLYQKSCRKLKKTHDIVLEAVLFKIRLIKKRKRCV